MVTEVILFQKDWSKLLNFEYLLLRLGVNSRHNEAYLLTAIVGSVFNTSERAWGGGAVHRDRCSGLLWEFGWCLTDDAAPR